MNEKRGIKIGVLGGIGPEATALFYKKLILQIQKELEIQSNTDFPQIIINSIPAPELVGNKIKEKELGPYVKGLKELDSMGPDFIIMVCNTIHLYLDYLQGHVKTPILNLREEIRKELTGINYPILVIVTKKTINSGLYEFEGMRTMKPNKREIEALSKAILFFNNGQNKKEPVLETKKLCKKYLKRGAKRVLLGCTEFGVMLENQKIPTINSLDIMVNATIKRISNTKQEN